MLIKRAVLQRIKSGKITLAFRRWQRPTVRSGGMLRTAIGELKIHRVAKTTLQEISEEDARCAGYGKRADLIAEMRARKGDDYRIELSYAGTDRRLTLREDDQLSEEALAALVERLRRMDRRSVSGAWTRRVLESIARHPRVVSTELAGSLGVKRDWLKPSIRKLKNLGLTISHDRGYSLSARGRRAGRCRGIGASVSDANAHARRARYQCASGYERRDAGTRRMTGAATDP